MQQAEKYVQRSCWFVHFWFQKARCVVCAVWCIFVSEAATARGHTVLLHVVSKLKPRLGWLYVFVFIQDETWRAVTTSSCYMSWWTEGCRYFVFHVCLINFLLRVCLRVWDLRTFCMNWCVFIILFNYFNLNTFE